jgi:hypothetical protein
MYLVCQGLLCRERASWLPLSHSSISLNLWQNPLLLSLEIRPDSISPYSADAVEIAEATGRFLQEHIFQDMSLDVKLPPKVLRACKVGTAVSRDLWTKTERANQLLRCRPPA